MQTQLLSSFLHFNIHDSSVYSCTSEDSIFDKYKNGHSNPSSAFRIYSTDVSSIGDSDKNQSEEHRVRGSYRKYTLEEKEEAVAKVIFELIQILNGHDVK